MVDGAPANIGIGFVFPILSSSLATGVPALPCTGNAPVALGARRVNNSSIRCFVMNRTIENWIAKNVSL